MVPECASHVHVRARDVHSDVPRLLLVSVLHAPADTSQPHRSFRSGPLRPRPTGRSMKRVAAPEPADSVPAGWVYQRRTARQPARVQGRWLRLPTARRQAVARRCRTAAHPQARRSTGLRAGVDMHQRAATCRRPVAMCPAASNTATTPNGASCAMPTSSNGCRVRRRAAPHPQARGGRSRGPGRNASEARDDARYASRTARRDPGSCRQRRLCAYQLFVRPDDLAHRRAAVSGSRLPFFPDPAESQVRRFVSPAGEHRARRWSSHAGPPQR